MNPTPLSACARAEAWIEPMASGETAPTEITTHVDGCARCQGAVEVARAAETTLGRGFEPVVVPRDFARRVTAAVRRERWAAEERFDRAFNLAMAAGAVVIVASLAAFFNLPALGHALAAAYSAAETLSLRVPLASGATRPVAAASVLVLLAAVSAWWWSEQGDAWS